MTVTRDELAAWVDGVMTGEEATRVFAAVEADPVLASEAAQMRALRGALSAHFAPILSEPVPDRLSALLNPGEGAQVVDFTAARQAAAARPALRQGWLRYGGAAIAAALVLAVVLRVPSGGAVYAEGPLVAALDAQMAASQPADAPVRIVLSFAKADGSLCRGFTSAERNGVACRDARGWKLERSLPGTSVQSTDYRQAGSGGAELMAAIEGLAAGEPLDAAGEAAAAARGWRR